MKINLSNVYKIRIAHFQCMDNHYAKFEYKGMKTVGVTDYTNQKPQPISDEKMSKFNIRIKSMKIFMKCAQNRRCTFSICEQSLCKV